MLTSAPTLHVAGLAEARRSALVFAVFALGLVAIAALLAGFAPLGLAIATVFLFAGPHQWMELRYLLGRAPSRFGPLRGYFALGIGGAIGLFACFVALTMLGALDRGASSVGVGVFGTLLVAWVVALALLRSRERPVRDWGFVTPTGAGVIALAWLAPTAWSVAWVYLHPMVALWMLDRELRRRRPAWRPAYHGVLTVAAVALGALVLTLRDAAPLPTDDPLAGRVVEHAGALLLPFVSSRLLVAGHTFLETLHYGVWIVAIPLAGMRTAPWSLGSIPLARRGAPWRAFAFAALAIAATFVVVLWVAFAADHATARDVYFLVAVVHVLAELPLLIRAL